MVDLLTENIDSWKDVGEVQDQSEVAQFGKRQGVVVAEWSVAGEMNRQGVTALAIGNYVINDVNGDALVIPDGAVLSKLMIRDDTVAKAGAGTITPAIETAAGTTYEAMDNAVGSVATYVDDNGASNSFVLGFKWTADANIKVTVAGNTVTAGAFSLYIEYFIGQYA